MKAYYLLITLFLILCFSSAIIEHRRQVVYKNDAHYTDSALSAIDDSIALEYKRFDAKHHKY